MMFKTYTGENYLTRPMFDNSGSSGIYFYHLNTSEYWYMCGGTYANQSHRIELNFTYYRRDIYRGPPMPVKTKAIIGGASAGGFVFIVAFCLGIFGCKRREGRFICRRATKRLQCCWSCPRSEQEARKAKEMNRFKEIRL